MNSRLRRIEPHNVAHSSQMADEVVDYLIYCRPHCCRNYPEVVHSDPIAFVGPTSHVDTQALYQAPYRAAVEASELALWEYY